jgi:hypothetical protein
LRPRSFTFIDEHNPRLPLKKTPGSWGLLLGKAVLPFAMIGLFLKQEAGL